MKKKFVVYSLSKFTPKILYTLALNKIPYYNMKIYVRNEIIAIDKKKVCIRTLAKNGTSCQYEKFNAEHITSTLHGNYTCKKYCTCYICSLRFKKESLFLSLHFLRLYRLHSKSLNTFGDKNIRILTRNISLFLNFFWVCMEDSIINKFH